MHSPHREQLPDRIGIRAVVGIPDLRPGDDLAGMIHASAPWIDSHDIVVVTSKAVSKVEGRLISAPVETAEREAARRKAIDDESVSVVAQRGPTKVVRTRHGLTMAAAGVDGSNVRSDEIALLPLDPDASAARLRAELQHRWGLDVSVVITDTAGRNWRLGLVDIAIGSAGIEALRDLRGGTDTHGHPLAVTAMAQIDQLASASELVRGKLAQVPVAVISGVPWTGDTAGQSSARDLIRPLIDDMFSLGTRDVVPAADSLPIRIDRQVGDRLLTAAVIASGLENTLEVDLVDDPVVVLTSEQPGLITGVALGKFLVALRAEGLAASWTSKSTGASTRIVLRVGAAPDYQGHAGG